MMPDRRTDWPIWRLALLLAVVLVGALAERSSRRKVPSAAYERPTAASTARSRASVRGMPANGVLPAPKPSSNAVNGHTGPRPARSKSIIPTSRREDNIKATPLQKRTSSNRLQTNGNLNARLRLHKSYHHGVSWSQQEKRMSRPKPRSSKADVPSKEVDEGKNSLKSLSSSQTRGSNSTAERKLMRRTSADDGMPRLPPEEHRLLRQLEDFQSYVQLLIHSVHRGEPLTHAGYPLLFPRLCATIEQYTRSIRVPDNCLNGQLFVKPDDDVEDAPFNPLEDEVPEPDRGTIAYILQLLESMRQKMLKPIAEHMGWNRDPAEFCRLFHYAFAAHIVGHALAHAADIIAAVDPSYIPPAVPTSPAAERRLSRRRQLSNRLRSHLKIDSVVETSSPPKKTSKLRPVTQYWTMHEMLIARVKRKNAEMAGWSRELNHECERIVEENSWLEDARLIMRFNLTLLFDGTDFLEVDAASPTDAVNGSASFSDGSSISGTPSLNVTPPPPAHRSQSPLSAAKTKPAVTSRRATAARAAASKRKRADSETPTKGPIKRQSVKKTRGG